MMRKMADPYLINPDLVINLHGISVPLEYLFRGMLIVGQPGAGKTRMILMPLLREILRATGNDPEKKAGMIIVDPKNELTPFITEIAQETGRSDDVIVFKPQSAFYNPLNNPFMTDSELTEKLILFSAHTNRSTSRRPGGEDIFWANALRALLGAVVILTRITSEGKLSFALLDQTLAKINSYTHATEATAWLTKIAAPPGVTRAVTDYLRLPAETTRPCVNSSATNTLQAWRKEPLASLTEPSETVPEIDPFAVIDQGKLLVIGCASAAYGASITPLLLALKEHIFMSLLSRDQIEVNSAGIWRSINQTRPVFFVADEFQSYLTGDSSAGELAALDRLRGFNAGYIGATQNLASIHSVLGSTSDATRLIALFANQIYMANTCPFTATQASWIMGSKKQRHEMRATQMAPPLLSSCRTHRKIKVPRNDTPTGPRVDANTLAAMKTGEFWFRAANGKVYDKYSSRCIR